VNNPTPAQLKKLERLAKVVDGGDIALLNQVIELDEKLDKVIETAQESIEIAKQTKKMKGEKGDRGESIKGDAGYTPVKGVDYFDGKDGRTPIYIGNKQPINPQKGDLWYQD
jgi:hypothetical protein